MQKPSEISTSSTIAEPYILEDIALREVSLDKVGTSKRLYIKIDGTNNKTGQREQIKIHFDPSDSEALAIGINAVVKGGLFEK